jgi:hypothetical protein
MDTMDRSYWQVERYKEFLAERQRLLAKAANSFLDELMVGAPAAITTVDYPTELTQVAVTIAMEEKDEVQSILSFVTANGLPRPELDYDVVDPVTGETLATVDAAWPKGIQEEYSQPVALVFDTSKAIINILNQAGYRFFTDIKALHRYLKAQTNGHNNQFNGAIAGAAEFVAAIADAQKDAQPILQRLSDWAVALEQEGLVKLLTYYGKAGWLSLLPRLEPEGVGLVSIYNINGKVSLQLWRSVFTRRAPVSLLRVEHLIGVIGQGTHIREFGDPLLNELTLAYREAAGRDAKG